MTLEIFFNAAGGLALFMMAMTMMTDGLKVCAGSALKTILRRWTSNTVKSVLSGALITAFVQSSSAVTVATIGFVNAGLLSLHRALGVIFGANIGTTMTGWLVSIMGFGIKLESLSMPILAVGVLIYYITSSKRYQGLGEALIGFALFFLALSILKSAFSGISEAFGTGLLTTPNVGGAMIFVLMGFVMTVLTQSSSAAIALILTAANEGIIGVNASAAAVIGANVGTTSTAVLAAINATPNAKRVAAGHVAFNVITAIIALILLPMVIWFVSEAGHLIGVKDQPASFLAFFHTVFNVLGVILLVPFVRRLAIHLGTFFKTQEESISLPQYLDKTVVQTPVLAMEALWKELGRLYSLSCDLVSLAFTKASEKKIKLQSEAVYSLGKSIDEFTTHIRMENMAREQSETLPTALRSARYLEEVVRLTRNLYTLSHKMMSLKHKKTAEQLESFLSVVKEVISLFAAEDGSLHTDRLEKLTAFQDAYQETKALLLQSASSRHLSIEDLDELLDALSRTRRLIEQLAKAERIIHQKRNGADTEHSNEKEIL